jgi:hypothetical protein
MSWKQDPDDTLKHSYSGFVKDLIAIIDERIERVVTDNPKRGLIDAIARIYWDSAWELKLHNGTSAQWPWLAEFCVFRVVRKQVEKKTRRRMIPKRVSRWALKFVDTLDSPQYELYHSHLPDKVNGKRIRPDVALFRRGKLLFTMDVKVALASSATLIDALEKLIQTATFYGSEGYLVVVAQNLTFSVDAVRNRFLEFVKRAKGQVIGPRGGTAESKVKELGQDLHDLEPLLSKI